MGHSEADDDLDDLRHGRGPFDAATGRKDDSGKARWDLLPWGPVGDIVAVLTYGARKYADDNWQIVPDPRRRYFAAAMRRLTAWYSGERRDPESGLPHLAHAGCCLLFLLWFDSTEAKLRKLDEVAP